MLYTIDEKTFDNALDLCKEALILAESLGFKLAIYRSLMIIGDLHVGHGDHEKAKEYFQRAREVAVDAGYEVYSVFCEKKIAELKSNT